MSARSSRGLQRIESSFNRTIAEGYLKPGQQQQQMNGDGSDAQETDQKKNTKTKKKKKKKSGLHQSGTKSATKAAEGEVRERASESGAVAEPESGNAYIDEWAWEWDREMSPRDQSPRMRGRLVSTAEYIYYNTAVLSVLIRIVVATFLYGYASTVALLSSTNVFLSYLTHFHRNPSALLHTKRTSTSSAGGGAKMANGDDTTGERALGNRDDGDDTFRNSGEDGAAALDEDGASSFFAVPVEATNQRKRLGVFEEVTDYLELLFTRASGWMSGASARSETDIEGVGARTNASIGAAGAASSPFTSDGRGAEGFDAPEGVVVDEDTVLNDESFRSARKRSDAGQTSTSSYDDRTVADMIREAGYPCEVHQIVTPDGYHLQMFRIPRRKAAKGSVLFIHGVYDSAMGYVSGGLCSQPYAAYDLGFDVWLGNLRICSPWKREGGNFAAAYWNFSINELAIYDCRSFVEHIQRTHAMEVDAGGEMSPQPASPSVSPAASMTSTENGNDGDTITAARVPSRSPLLDSVGDAGAASSAARHNAVPIQIVAHSLGGSVALIYMTWRQRRLRFGSGTLSKKPSARDRQHHRVRRPSLPPDGVSRLILLSPAGFHHYKPPMAVFLWVLIDRLFGVVFRRLNFGLYIPTRIGRLLLHKLMQDVVNMPSLMSLVNLVVGRLSLSDSSDFATALHLPHLSPDAMVGCSYKLCVSLYRCYMSGRFVTFDNYGNKEKNMQQFFSPEAIDVAADYKYLDVPVVITAGTRDGVIRPQNIKAHYDAMKQANVPVSYHEFRLGHLEFLATGNVNCRLHNDFVVNVLDSAFV